MVSASGELPANVVVRDGKIVALTEHDTVFPAEQVIDCTGKYVLPGVVDAHVHLRDPGKVEREDFETGTRAAAAGGVTTILEMPISLPPVYTADILRARQEGVAAKAVVDYAFYGAAGADNLEEIPRLAAEGVVGFKTFLHSPPPGREKEFVGLCAVGSGVLREILRCVATTGKVSAVHVEDDSIVQWEINRLKALGRNDGPAHAESRPEIAEIVATAQVLALARDAGVRVHLAHMSSPVAVEMARQARRSGVRVTVETCPQYLLLTEEELARQGPFAKINPPMRSEASREGMWRLLLEGAIDLVASDHSPFLLEEKERGFQDIWMAPAGSPGLETLLPLMLTEVASGRLTLSHLVRLVSENPARIFGLYPRKGAVRVGSDADLVVVDMQAETTIRRERMYTKARDSARLYEGRRVQGLPVLVAVRGNVVMRDGEVVGRPGWGQFVRPE